MEEEKKMAAAAGVESIHMPDMAKALGGSEQMPRVMNIAVPEVVEQRDDLEKEDVISIRELPDYRHVDSSGFLTDVWNAFKDDTKRIWRERKTTEDR